MFKYISKWIEDAKIYTYNYFNGNIKDTQTYPKLLAEYNKDETVPDAQDVILDDKQLRIDTLLFVRQFKNTYYKYTNKQKFNVELYNSFVDDKNFDGGDTGYDDDDKDVRIFDRYILEYIKHRSDILTYMQCKNKDVVLKQKLEQLEDAKTSGQTIDVLFSIDMSEKDLFNYCYSIIQKNGNVSMIKNICFSLILKFQGEYVRVKLSAFTKNKNNHPYLILERFLA